MSEAAQGPCPEQLVTIHLVRHGETDWNLEGRLQGWTDIPLNATGIEQAHAAAAALAGRAIGAVISSDLARARATAAVIAAEFDVEVVTDPALRERNYGVAEGRLSSELDLELGGRLDEHWADPDFTFGGGETRRDTYSRLGTFLANVIASGQWQELVVVSHGGALRVARGFLEGIPVEHLPSWNFANGEVATLVVEAAERAHGTVRRARRDEASAIADLWLASRRAAEIPPTVRTDDEVRAWVSDVLLPSHEVWVAVDGEQVVGMLALHGASIEQLYISPAHQRRGHGARLLRRAMAQSGSLLLWTFEVNVAAQRFYEAHGFTRSGSVSHDNEERAPAIRYRWQAPGYGS